MTSPHADTVDPPKIPSSGLDKWVSASPAARICFADPDWPELSIVTVTYGTSNVLLRSLEVLAACLAADGVSADVTVVDHPHPERGRSTSDMLRLATSGVHVIAADQNFGFGGGNELGIAYTRAPILCLMNPDTSFSPGAIRSLVGLARLHSDAVIAPTLRNPDGSVQERGQQLTPLGMTVPLTKIPADINGHVLELSRSQFVSAACWFFNRGLHERVGGFDPDYHPAYYEDADYTMRVRQIGGRVLVATDVDVVHERGGSTHGPPPDTRRQRATFVDRWGSLLG